MKNNKRSIILVISILMVFVLTGCGLLDNQPDDYPEAGQWIESDMFVNEWFGIQFQLPGGWDAPTGSELEQLLGVGTMLMEGSDLELSDEMLEAMEERAAHDMYALSYTTGSTAQIVFERVPRALRSIDIEVVLENASAGLEEMGVDNTRVRENSFFIGDLEFHVIDAVMNMFGMEIHMSTFINLENRNIRSITVGSGDQSEIDVIMGYFNVVGAERIESVAPEFELPEVDEGLVAADFIGLWDWDSGDYIYDFREDGTGTRGFTHSPELEEEFTWELAGGELQIRIDMMIELWRPTIEGNVLTISSLQMEGLSYSYIRR
jgi:predicted dehydrogenase